ncbi:MAG: protoporphyrinogen oxidase [Longimicrobiales bacterium]
MIAIVGAGISGLALAHALAARNIPFVVLEESGTAGGVIRSRFEDGHLLELGPQRTRLVPGVKALVGDLGLNADLITAPSDLPLFVYRDGALRTVPRSFAELARTDLLGGSAKLRVLLEPFTRGESRDESVAHYFTRKLGRDAYNHLVGPLYGGLYASDPANMQVGLSLGHTLRELGVHRSLIMRGLRAGGRLRVPAACSFRQGMQTLPVALAERHASNVRFHTRVAELSGSRGAFRIETESGVIQAERVVMTTAAQPAALLLSAIAPEASLAIASLRYNPLAIVHMHSMDEVKRGFGFQVSFAEEMFTRGVTFNHAMFERTGVYTSYLGGAQHAEVVSWTDDRIAGVACDEFQRVTGASARTLSVTRAAMPAWDRSWSALQNLPAIDGIHFCTNWEGRPGVPGRIAAAQRLAARLA